ncbi:MAG: hypothetical protein IBJ12_08175 [Sphingomonadaceae bacterium]|nr:hypothetical protein [Sphingomonadaceae bacterium]
MPTILDIAGKPIPPRNRARRRLQSQDIRDLLKILIVILLVITGFFAFVPERNAAEEIRVAAAQKAQG